jgi:NADH:ubiquinone reductase (H+-translocating)
VGRGEDGAQALKKVVIVGAGFAGLNAAKQLRRVAGVEVTVIDRENHHLFQPLLYQVAMAALSPADIAVPIRSVLADRNMRIIKTAALRVDVAGRRLHTQDGEFAYDYLLLACGAQHAYFGQEQWEELAPGLKTLPQATEIRRRVLEAFEAAEREEDVQARRRHLTFVLVGGGPTGVELAGAIGEMSRYTLARDFRSIDPRQTRVILVEAGPRILPAFDESLAARAMRDLESLGVQVWTGARVSQIDAQGVRIGTEQIEAATVLWGAGVRAADIGKTLGAPLDSAGRVLVEADLSIPGHPQVFVAGDLSNCRGAQGQPLPGVAAVAKQQGTYVAVTIRGELGGRSRVPFRYDDKGKMATIGRSRAVCELGKLRFSGWFAWWVWLLVHIYYLSGFRNRISVFIQWAWSYLTLERGARLIVDKEWRAYPAAPASRPAATGQSGGT